MTGPTREELDGVVGALHRMRERRDLYDGEAADLQAAYDLLHAYPLPSENGERAQVAVGLQSLAATLAEHFTLVQVWEWRISLVLRAADLLRQPPPPPAAGVSKEAVCGLIYAAIGREAFRLPRDGEALMAEVEALPGAAPPPRGSGGRVIQEIAAERRRQVEVEGWTREHDVGHVHGELAQAACCYAMPAKGFAAGWWPWDWAYFRRKDRRRDLIRAAALLVAEIERLDGPEREEPSAAPPSGVDREAVTNGERKKANLWREVAVLMRGHQRKGEKVIPALQRILATIPPEAKPVNT